MKRAAPRYPYPMPVVRLIIEDEQGHVLLLRRSNTDHAPDTWCLPGGKIDFGDTVEESARRELIEETGLSCTQIEFLFYQDSLPTHEGPMHCIDFYLKCRVEGDVCINEESSQFSWVSPDNLGTYKMAFKNDEGLRHYWSIKCDDHKNVT